MKERPILFSAPMVRALLEGRKTQTRRVVKPQPHVDELNNFVWNGWNFGQSAGGVPHIQSLASPVPWSKTKRVLCPYGAPGDRLWVRESFWGCDAPGFGDQPCVVYDDEWHGKEYRPAEIRPWARKFGRIPAIHMPRDCSRITLEITGVRVERLQQISEADAAAEGIQLLNGRFTFNDGLHESRSARDSFAALWESINGAESWESNHWVWVIEFARITTEDGK